MLTEIIILILLAIVYILFVGFQRINHMINCRHLYNNGTYHNPIDDEYSQNVDFYDN